MQQMWLRAAEDASGSQERHRAQHQASLAAGTLAGTSLGGQQGHRQQQIYSDQTPVPAQFLGRGEQDMGKSRVSLCSVQGKQRKASLEGAGISSAAAFGDEQVPGLALRELQP